MSKIKILTQEVINKIAAGEVVERPASIVKELLENSIDANSSTIKISIEEGGAKKIVIVDNGTGMSLDDLKVCILPHATSKLTTEEDLLNINSFGFRGEALSSIVAVSKVTITTRVKDQETGYELKVSGGYMDSLTEIGCPIGTTIVVEDLFYNVPARIEFIRSAPTEYKAVLDVVNSMALAYPDIGITFINNGNTVYSMPKKHQLEDRVKQILGTDFADKLIPVFYEHPHIEVYGFIAKPELASSKRKEQMLFVNKRYIQDKAISYAIKDAYAGLIPAGSFPGYIIFIDVPGNIVDVNIHPRKEEVKFSNTTLIYSSIKQAVKKALERNTLVPGSNQTPNMPNFPGMPMMPGMPSMPSMPSMPGMPAMPIRPAMPGMPAMPTMAGLQGLAAMPGMQAMPGMRFPAMQAIPFGMPQNPNGQNQPPINLQNMLGQLRPMGQMPVMGTFPQGIMPMGIPMMPGQMPNTGMPNNQQSNAVVDPASIEPSKKENDTKPNTDLDGISGKISLKPKLDDSKIDDVLDNFDNQTNKTIKTDDVTQKQDNTPNTNFKPLNQIQSMNAMPGMQSFGGLNNQPFSPFKPMQMGQMPQFGQKAPNTTPFWNDPYGLNNANKNNDNTNADTVSDKKLFIAHKLYIFKETKDGVMVYDQHAVHERIMYEKLIKEHENKKSGADVQNLLAPVIINLSVHENATMTDYKEEIIKLGFNIEDFGPNTYKITSVPNILAKLDIKNLIHEYLEDLENDSAIKSVDTKSNKILTYLACRSAYKAGDTILEKEALAMIEKLEKGENTYTCPHGRPVKIELTLTELAKMFKRTGFE